MNEKFSWLKGGLLLGVVFLAAVWLVKPVGVSTEFAIVDGIFRNILSQGFIAGPIALIFITIAFLLPNTTTEPE